MPNEAQKLVLINFAEECAEGAQAATKILRFGLQDFHPKHPGSTNEELFVNEFADIVVCFEAMEIDQFIWGEHFEERKQIKRQKLVNRHPEVFGPIFNMTPNNVIEHLTAEDEQYQVPVPEEELPPHLRRKQREVQEGDSSWGGITGKEYVARKHRNFMVWVPAEEFYP